MATVRSRRVSRARYTSPIPPAPISRRTSHGPRRTPDASDMERVSGNYMRARADDDGTAPGSTGHVVRSRLKQEKSSNSPRTSRRSVSIVGLQSTMEGGTYVEPVESRGARDGRSGSCILLDSASRDSGHIVLCDDGQRRRAGG